MSEHHHVAVKHIHAADGMQCLAGGPRVDQHMAGAGGTLDEQEDGAGEGLAKVVLRGLAVNSISASASRSVYLIERYCDPVARQRFSCKP